jgi:hypothetical protein
MRGLIRNVPDPPGSPQLTGPPAGATVIWVGTTLPMPFSQIVASPRCEGAPGEGGTTCGGMVTVVDTYRNQRPLVP